MYSPFEGRDGIESFIKAKISTIKTLIFRAAIRIIFVECAMNLSTAIASRKLTRM